MVSTTGTPVSLKADLWFPIPGQQGHGARIIHQEPSTYLDVKIIKILLLIKTFLLAGHVLE